MPFVKLDCGILMSTIWFDEEARIIFITALLMAEPREFTEPVAEVCVDSTNDTGWSAPPGWYGFVPASGPGIIHRALGVEQQAGIEALRRLASPEAESRSKEFEGRRMIRVNGGYLILNYEKYRERDYTAADRMRRYRKKIRGDRKSRRTVTRNSNAVTRHVTQAEVEVEVDSRGQKQESKDTHTPLAGEPRGFTELWERYPRRVGRKAALRHFTASVLSTEDWVAIQQALNRYLESGEVKRGFVQHGSTWFNNWRDWVNYVEPPPPTPSVPVSRTPATILAEEERVPEMSMEQKVNILAPKIHEWFLANGDPDFSDDVRSEFTARWGKNLLFLGDSDPWQRWLELCQTHGVAPKPARPDLAKKAADELRRRGLA